MSPHQASFSTRSRTRAPLRRWPHGLLGALGLLSAGLPAGLALGAVAGGTPAGAVTATAPTSQTIDFNSGQSQTFVVPATVTHVTITAFGGSGAVGQSFLNEGETDAAAGPGGEVSAGLSVTPGQTFIVDVGQAGSQSPANDYTGGAGGSGSGDGMNGAAGGNGVSNQAAPGGGGGGGTAVYLDNNGQAGQMVMAAGGGGGGGGAGLNGENGGNGGTSSADVAFNSTAGQGSNGANALGGAGAGGLFNTLFTPAGSAGSAGQGNGGGGGGGGGGAFVPSDGYYGGGGGGSAGTTSGGGGGGGAGGDSWAWSGAGTPSFGQNRSGNGSVVFSWLPSDQVSLTANPPQKVTVGQPVTYTATVATSGGTPGGTVSFSDGQQVLCSNQPLTASGDSGTATCQTSYATPGSHSITATYAGDGTFPSEASQPLSEQAVPVETFFVETTGTDTNNATCAKASPCATVAHAVSEATAGDHVSIGPGTFGGNVVVQAPITIMGAGQATVISSPAGTDGLQLDAAATIERLAIHDGGKGFNQGSAVTVSGGAPIFNKVNLKGGSYGLYVTGGAPSFDRGTISDADVGVYANQAGFSLTDATVIDSQQDGVVSVQSQGQLKDTTVASTTGPSGSGGVGSGLGVSEGTVSVVDSTVTGNAGGGIYVTPSSQLTVVGSTVAHNAAPGITGTSSSTTSVASSMFAANAYSDCGEAVIDAGYNLADDNTCGFSAPTDHVGVDPLLGPLAANGGPTETEAPQSQSPAVDAIPTGTQVSLGGTEQALCTGTDQRGVPRPQPAGGTCDIGAVELAPVTLSVAATPNPSVNGQKVDVTATVADGLGHPALPAPAGTVTFSHGGSPIPGCTALPLSSGKATCSGRIRTVIGALSPLATFDSTDGYHGAASFLDTNINPAPTRTVLRASLNPVTAGHQVTFTAKVRTVPPASGRPNGGVRFSVGGRPLPHCSLRPLNRAAKATCTVTFGASGTHKVTAHFGAPGAFASSSASFTETVTP